MIPYGENGRRNKVDPFHIYYFKKGLYDVELKSNDFKIDNSIDVDTIMKKYYIYRIKYLTIDNNGESCEKILENEKYQDVSEYIANRIDNYADIFKLYGLKETY